jgi:tetratricopeptide (TPR) repeat protein
MRVTENAPGIWVKIQEISAKSMNRYKNIGMKITPYSPIGETAFKRRKTLDYLFFYPRFSIDLSHLIQRFLYIIIAFCSILLAKEQTWTTTTFDYYWNILLRRNIYREPISFTPFDIRVGQLTYGGSDYWDSSLFETRLGTTLPVVLDSTTTTFDIINSEGNRKALFLEVDFLRINVTNYLYYQNLVDLQFGLGYSRMSASSNPSLPVGWNTQLPTESHIGKFRFRPIINTFNFNTSLTFQATNFLMGYAYHALGYSAGTLYETTGGDYYLEGKGVSEAFALGLRAVYHPKNRPFSFVYGIEGRWHHTKFLTVDDFSHISHITGLDLHAKGLFITFGTIFGGKRTSGDHGFAHLVNQRYEEASSGFEKFIGDYPNHSRKSKAEEMLAFSYAQIPFQQFRQGLESLKDKDLDTAAGWLSKASGTADEDLLFEINSRKKDLAMVLIDSVALHKSEMTFRQAEDIIQKARRIAPEYPLGDDALAELYLEKGDVLFQRKSFNTAYTYYKKALQVSIESKTAVKKKYNDLIVGLMDEANLFTEQEEYILAIQSLETIIEIHPKRQDDLGPVIEELSLKLAEIEADETRKTMKEMMQVKQREIDDKSRHLLLLGMTLHQAMEITGEPTFTDKIDRGGRLYEMWSFDDNPKAKRLYFEDNLLVKIEK